MKIISHRGNLQGTTLDKENNPEWIDVVSKNFDVEIDVRLVGETFLLGHDEPKYPVSSEWLKNERFWCHAKDIKTLDALLDIKVKHCFFHDTDDCTLTSSGYIWTFPNRPTCKRTVIVDLQFLGKYKDCFGVCTDYVKT